jgi:hypothetical protein
MGNIHTSSSPYATPVSTLPFTLTFSDDASFFDANTPYTLLLAEQTFTNYTYVSPSQIYFTNVVSNVAGNIQYQISDDKGNIYIGTLNVQLICYAKGTKILCYPDKYIPIEDINEETLVKTYKYGYKKVHSIRSTLISHKNNVLKKGKYYLNEMYVMKKDMINIDVPLEDLYVTGGHSILVDDLTGSEKTFMNQFWSELPKIDEKYLLLSSGSKLFEEYNNYDILQVYHIAIESDDIHKQYGIYANNVLSESISIYNIQYLHTLIKL